MPSSEWASRGGRVLRARRHAGARSGTWSDAFDTFTDDLLVGDGPGGVLCVSMTMSLEQTRYVWVLTGMVTAGLGGGARTGSVLGRVDHLEPAEEGLEHLGHAEGAVGLLVVLEQEDQGA